MANKKPGGEAGLFGSAEILQQNMQAA